MLEQESPASDSTSLSFPSPEHSGRTVPARLSWRIPADFAPRWSFKAWRVLIAGAVALAVGMVLSGGASAWLLIAMAVVAAIGAAFYFFWRGRREQVAEQDNIWLDATGLHWNDGAAEGSLPREQVEGFRLGLDPDTVRAIPALTLILVGGFESQPVELHAPASPVDVREYLAREWNLEEAPLDDHRQSALLYRTFETALSASPAPSEAEYLLLACLVEPVRQADGSWLIFHLPSDVDVYYEPQGARLELSTRPADGPDDLAGLVDFVAEHVLPAEESEREAMLAETEEIASRNFEQGAAADARACGFCLQADEANRRWLFQGSRERLLALAERFAFAASFTAPPPGARPVQVRIGGLYHGVTLEVNRYEGVADDVLCAAPSKLRFVADDLREQLADASTSEIEIPLLLGEVRWTLACSPQFEGFDPGETLEGFSGDPSPERV